MIPKEIIEKAIEGGYAPEPYRHRQFIRTSRKTYQHLQTSGASMPYSEIILDPLFWQSLGKALEWKEKNKHHIDNEKRPALRCTLCNGKPMVGDGYCSFSYSDEWKEKALCFFDLLLTNGDTEKFWEDLVSIKK
jgi:hypothetical protein